VRGPVKSILALSSELDHPARRAEAPNAGGIPERPNSALA